MQGAHYFGSFSIVVIIAAVITGTVFLFTGIRQKRVRNLPIIICSLFVLAGAVGAVYNLRHFSIEIPDNAMCFLDEIPGNHNILVVTPAGEHSYTPRDMPEGMADILNGLEYRRESPWQQGRSDIHDYRNEYIIIRITFPEDHPTYVDKLPADYTPEKYPHLELVPNEYKSPLYAGVFYFFVNYPHLSYFSPDYYNGCYAIVDCADEIEELLTLFGTLEE